MEHGTAGSGRLPVTQDIRRVRIPYVPPLKGGRSVVGNILDCESRVGEFKSPRSPQLNYLEIFCGIIPRGDLSYVFTEKLTLFSIPLKLISVTFLIH